ncbi:MAG TPA: penicillin-binding protein 2 [Clostridia bacterium]|nr:penicillin-binding protein 2 [Clostridia bacterium]
MALPIWQRRIGVFAVILVMAIMVLLGRLAQLQLVHGQEFAELADGNRIRIQIIKAPRGKILDRNGAVLASNRASTNVSFLHMGPRIDVEEVASRLASILGMSEQEIRSRIENPETPLYMPVLIKEDISPEVQTRLEEDAYDLPGVVLEMEPKRVYPNGDFAGHLLGYLREIGQEELREKYSKGYRMGDQVGQMGVEALFDEDLHGTNGGRQIEVDVRGRFVRAIDEMKPIPGDDIVLTVDAGLQATVERELKAQLERLQHDPVDPAPNAKAAAAVVMKVDTGEILAMVSIPGFDPNIFSGRISAVLWNSLQNDPLKPLTNRAVTGEYSPGSSFKMVTATAALEEKKVSPTERVTCGGTYFRVMPKKCWQKGGHGPVDVRQALGVSCNVFFYEMGYRVGIDKLAEYAERFGLGVPTGFQFVPREKPGLIPSTEWKKAAYEHHLPGINDPRWYDAETLDAAIGQGFHKVTPLQMAVYVSSIANGGKRYVPFIAREIRSPDGKVIAEFEPRVAGDVGVSQETLKTIREGMLRVTQPGGTAAGAFRDFPLKVGGKTGTVQMDPSLGMDDHGWFVGFAPYDKPEIAVAIIVEQGKGGARAAAPVARRIFEKYFGLSGGEAQGNSLKGDTPSGE